MGKHRSHKGVGPCIGIYSGCVNLLRETWLFVVCVLRVDSHRNRHCNTELIVSIVTVCVQPFVARYDTVGVNREVVVRDGIGDVSVRSVHPEDRCVNCNILTLRCGVAIAIFSP